MGIKISIVGIGFLAIFLFGTVPHVLFQKSTITFYDIGQGDALHVRTKTGFDVVIDAGPGTDTLTQKLSHDVPWYDYTIEIMMATHFDADHITGFSQALDSYKVETFILNEQIPETETAKKLIEKINAKHITIKYLKEGERLQLQNGISFTFYNTNATTADSSNDHSLVARLVTPHRTFLLTGDLEQPHEQKLIDAKTFLKSEVLKAGHHGSKTSSGDPFLDAVDPKEAVLSFGLNNKFHHPADETVQRLTKRNITLRKTVPEGDITYKW
jgi:competence protein ComEC